MPIIYVKPYHELARNQKDYVERRFTTQWYDEHLSYKYFMAYEDTFVSHWRLPGVTCEHYGSLDVCILKSCTHDSRICIKTPENLRYYVRSKDHLAEEYEVPLTWGVPIPDISVSSYGWGGLSTPEAYDEHSDSTSPEHSAQFYRYKVKTRGELSAIDQKILAEIPWLKDRTGELIDVTRDLTKNVFAEIAWGPYRGTIVHKDWVVLPKSPSAARPETQPVVESVTVKQVRYIRGLAGRRK